MNVEMSAANYATTIVQEVSRTKDIDQGGGCQGCARCVGSYGERFLLHFGACLAHARRECVSSSSKGSQSSDREVPILSGYRMVLGLGMFKSSGTIQGFVRRQCSHVYTHRRETGCRFCEERGGSGNRIEVMCAKVEGSLRGANAAPILNATEYKRPRQERRA